MAEESGHLTDEMIAQWMLDQLEETTYLDQQVAALTIDELFPGGSVYLNANGNLAIHRDILAAFKKVSGDTVVWDRSARAWRKRRPDDAPGRQQEY